MQKLKLINKTEKKALSQVLSTFMIVGLAVIATGLLGVLIVNISEKISASPEFDCIGFARDAPIKIIKACYDVQTKDLNLELEKNVFQQDLEIKDLEFIISERASSSSFMCGDYCSNCQILEQGRQTYYFDFNEKPLTATIKVNGCILETKDVREGC